MYVTTPRVMTAPAHRACQFSDINISQGSVARRNSLPAGTASHTEDRPVTS